MPQKGPGQLGKEVEVKNSSCDNKSSHEAEDDKTGVQQYSMRWRLAEDRLGHSDSRIGKR